VNPGKPPSVQSNRVATVIGVVIIVATIGCTSPEPETPTTAPPLSGSKIPATVSTVIDGDTIEVNLEGQLYTVRYIGVDTPETKHPQKDVQCFGPEATQRNLGLVEGQTVLLEKDVSETDRYGRLLRYVWLPDSRMVNEVLVAEGYAQVTTYPPDVRYTDRFRDAQRQAREANKGLWGKCTAPTPTQPPGNTGGPSTRCDPAYPTVCIPPFPPDLDCGEIPYRRFKVLPPDPHGFDRDRDGTGCES
jgi:micrococcal nuclease